MIVVGNAIEPDPVERVVPQGSPVSQILFAINASGLINWVQQYISEAEGLSFVYDLSWVATTSDANHVVSIHETCGAKSLKSASRGRLRFDTAKREVVLFTCTWGDTKHLPPKLSANKMDGNRSVRFNPQATRWLGVWMHEQLMIKEYNNGRMMEARAAEPRLRSLTNTYAVVPESTRAVQVVCV
jgi:hypothetical protein